MTLDIHEDFESDGQVDGAGLHTLLRCSRCGEWKPMSEFHASRTGQFSYCRECRNAYDRAYYANGGKVPRQARRRRAVDQERRWMAALKDGIACADCGETFPVYVMHWDHLPGFTKVDEVSAMVGNKSREAILEEIKKCELVCANCHVMRTVRRATGSPRKVERGTVID